MSNLQPTTVVTGQTRLSYVHLFKPYANQPNQEPKFSTTILIPKSDIATKQKVDAAIQTAIQQGVASKWNGVRPPQIAIPIHDGDGPRPSDGMPFGEECRGHWVMTASSKQQQAVVDANVQPILNQSEIYSGVYGRVTVNFFAYSSNGKKGVGCGLGPVQKLADGEPLGGQITAEAAFGSVPAVPYSQPAPQPQYAPPVQPGYVPQAQPGYAQPAPQYTPNYQQPAAYPQATQQAPAQPLQYDPITGAPLTGGIMGL